MLVACPREGAQAAFQSAETSVEMLWKCVRNTVTTPSACTEAPEFRMHVRMWNTAPCSDTDSCSFLASFPVSKGCEVLAAESQAMLRYTVDHHISDVVSASAMW